MDRRSFIKNTALAAALAGLAPAAMASNLKGGKKKKVIFILRGVSFTDAESAFSSINLTKNYDHLLLKCNSESVTYTHIEGILNLTEKLKKGSYELWHSQHMDRYTLSQVVPNAFASTSKATQIIYLHHTEIGHSSNKLYQLSLEEFFTELGKVYDPNMHKVVITADIGRNENVNSCGGRDHSNPSCHEIFAIYLGGDATKIKPKTMHQNQILIQKF